MSFIFSTLVESAKLLGLYILFMLSTAVANPLFPNENSTVTFVSEDEFGVVGSIHYRSPQYRTGRIRLMHGGGPTVYAVDRTPFEIWIKTDLDGNPFNILRSELKKIITTSTLPNGIARSEAEALGQAIGIDAVRSAGADFDRRIRGQLNELARNSGGGTVVSTGPFTEAFEGQYNAQLNISYNPATNEFIAGYHDSRGFTRSPGDITAPRLENLANYIDSVASETDLSIDLRNHMVATALGVEDSPYGNKLKATGRSYCRNL